MKHPVDEVWPIFEALMYNYPLWPSTFSMCDCGRMGARGASKCVLCLKEELASKVGDNLAEEAVQVLGSVQNVWAKIRDKVDK